MEYATQYPFQGVGNPLDLSTKMVFRGQTPLFERIIKIKHDVVGKFVEGLIVMLYLE